MFKKRIKVECPFCGGTTILKIPLSGIKGVLTAKTLATMPKEQYETFISGICAPCQKEILNKEGSQKNV